MLKTMVKTLVMATHYYLSTYLSTSYAEDYSQNIGNINFGYMESIVVMRVDIPTTNFTIINW